MAAHGVSRQAAIANNGLMLTEELDDNGSVSFADIDVVAS
jgi:hypothetical protein